MTPPPVESLLAIDIGNTRVGMAIFDSDGIHDTQRVATEDPTAWRASLEQVWAGAGSAATRAVVIGSVRPQTTRQITELVAEVCATDPLRIRDDLPLPLPLDIENPGEVGIDRICSAAAAYDRVRGPCAVASFGTAITIDCVSAEGRFMGGAIMPGLDMACDALHERTAALPRIRATQAGGVFGRNTHDAIVAGIVYGAVGALREIVEQFATELHEWPTLVLTGGNAPLVAEHANFVDAVVPDLCLMGIALSYRRASGAAPPSVTGHD